VRAFLVSLVLLLMLSGTSPRAEGSSALERAHKHYEAGVSLFESGNKEQALVEFQLANEIAPKKENVFMIAQCEYHLGQLVSARASYEAYLAEQTQGELADLARLRLEAINRRPGIFAINTVPDNVEVRIESDGATVVGQAPNEFRVPRGHYRITASKGNFASETRELSIDVAETKPLFFKLEPIPAHLTIRTTPPNAALFVRGNRTQNPYVQDVPPGNYEIYAEASYYQPKRESITLAPGENRVVEFPLNYVQRSGRPELIGFWTGIGAVGGGLAVLTQSDPRSSASPSLSLSLLSAGVLAGGIGLGVLSSTTSLVPNYIRDNLALFRIGAMWIGDVEGATLAMALRKNWTATWYGGAAGLLGGAVAGWWLDDKSPNYGRVSLIQSSALLGTVAGAIMVPAIGAYPAFREKDPGLDSTEPAEQLYNQHKDRYRNQIKQRLAWGMLAGLNVGLGAGLAMAYLPDQAVYGPSWQRVLMVDLAGVAGAIFATTVEICTKRGTSYCADANNDPNKPTKLDGRTARFALVGAGLGLAAGWLLTMSYDHNNHNQERPAPPLLSHIPLPGVVPVQSTYGTAELLPGLVSQGQF
jgi:hypothetical protein